MLVASFTSKNPTMGGLAHIKSCELLEALHLQLYRVISSEA